MKGNRYGFEGELDALGWLLFTKCGLELSPGDWDDMLARGYMTEDGKPTAAAHSAMEKRVGSMNPHHEEQPLGIGGRATAGPGHCPPRNADDDSDDDSYAYI